MGTHPIFESDFDCLTEVNFLKLCSLFDVDEVSLASAEHASLLLKLPPCPTKTRSRKTTCFGCAIKLRRKQTTTSKLILIALLRLLPLDRLLAVLRCLARLRWTRCVRRRGFITVMAESIT